MLATGCSCEQRLHRLRRHCPDRIETETVIDTLVIDRFRCDTAFVFERDIDTVLMETDRLKIELVKRFDTVRLSAEIPADTIYKERTVEKVIQVDRPLSFWEKARRALFGFVFCCLAFVAGGIFCQMKKL